MIHVDPQGSLGHHPTYYNPEERLTSTQTLKRGELMALLASYQPGVVRSIQGQSRKTTFGDDARGWKLGGGGAVEATLSVILAADHPEIEAPLWRFLDTGLADQSLAAQLGQKYPQWNIREIFLLAMLARRVVAFPNGSETLLLKYLDHPFHPVRVAVTKWLARIKPLAPDTLIELARRLAIEPHNLTRYSLQEALDKSESFDQNFSSQWLGRNRRNLQLNDSDLEQILRFENHTHRRAAINAVFEQAQRAPENKARARAREFFWENYPADPDFCDLMIAQATDPASPDSSEIFREVARFQQVKPRPPSPFTQRLAESGLRSESANLRQETLAILPLLSLAPGTEETLANWARSKSVDDRIAALSGMTLLPSLGSGSTIALARAIRDPDPEFAEWMSSQIFMRLRHVNLELMKEVFKHVRSRNRQARDRSLQALSWSARRWDAETREWFSLNLQHWPASDTFHLNTIFSNLVSVTPEQSERYWRLAVGKTLGRHTSAAREDIWRAWAARQQTWQNQWSCAKQFASDRTPPTD